MTTQDKIITIPKDKTEISRLPSTTGVYIFANSNEIFYIGKSVSIKARVKSHFENARLDYKEALIIEGSDRIKYILTDSEFKALILEAKLIQTYKPKYNVICRDDKSFLYIKISVKDEYPKLSSTRRENDGKSRYFGPFSCTRNVNEILSEIRKVFPFCTQKKISKKPCFYAKIGLCSPCPNVIDVCRDRDVKKRLRRQYLVNIRQIIKVLEGNTDLVLMNLHNRLDEAIREQNYEEGIELRDKILKFENFIHNQVFASENLTSFNQSAEHIESLEKLLKNYFSQIDHLHRIECYDVSSHSQKEATASMIVFTNGMIDRKEYRRFRIKKKSARSDFEMLEEVFRRRLARDWNLPDLIVVDGGRPQVRVFMRILANYPKKDIPIIGIAKRPDRLIIGHDDLISIRPQSQHQGFNLIRQIRDESHRFAKKYHLLLRRKRLMI